MKRTPLILNDPLTALTSDLSITLRLDYYVSTFKMFLIHPLWGQGLGSWPFFQNLGEDMAVHPHNIFLEIVSETGLIGFLLFMGLIFLVLKGVRLRLAIRDSVAMSLLLLLTFGFLNALKTGDLNDNIFFLCVLALASRSFTFSKDQQILKRWA